MAKRSTTEIAFSAIRIEGSLLAADFLGRVARFEATGQTEADYDIPKGCLWAIVSNGLKLRILRDNPSLTRPAYIEVDLEAIFNEERYPDFTAFWLLAHATRFGRTMSREEYLCRQLEG